MAEPRSGKRCMLLEIAPELRNHIYKEVFNENPSVAVDPDSKHLPALLFTCRQINKEATGMYYANATFTYTIPKPFSTTTAFQSLPTAFGNVIPKIRFTTQCSLKWLKKVEDDPESFIHFTELRKPMVKRFIRFAWKELSKPGGEHFCAEQMEIPRIKPEVKKSDPTAVWKWLPLKEVDVKEYEA